VSSDDCDAEFINKQYNCAIKKTRPRELYSVFIIYAVMYIVITYLYISILVYSRWLFELNASVIYFICKFKIMYNLLLYYEFRILN
jgi:hypothetical protein